MRSTETMTSSWQNWQIIKCALSLLYGAFLSSVQRTDGSKRLHGERNARSGGSKWKVKIDSDYLGSLGAITWL